MARDILEWKALFDQINAELIGDEDEPPVPLTDVEYYAQQIHNLTDEVDYDAAHAIAVELARLAEEPTPPTFTARQVYDMMMCRPFEMWYECAFQDHVCGEEDCRSAEDLVKDLESMLG